MEKKQARHLEWGHLQLRGLAPIMVGATIGVSQLMWVACRTSKNLVHVFQDGHLLSIWRFSSDPVFLLFVPPSEEKPAANSGSGRTDSSGKISEAASLLVFTLDTGVWHLDLANQGPTLQDRPTKKRKEKSSSEFSKCVPETLVKEADGRPSLVAGARNAGSSHCPELSGLQFQWERLAVHTQPRYSKKAEVKLVSEREFLCFAPAVSVAAFGPDDSVALLSLSGDLSILKIDFPHPSGNTPVKFVCESSQTMIKDPTCILFISVKLEGDTIPPRGNAAMVSTTLFETMFSNVETTIPVRGLLQGDRNGTVYTISLSQSKGGIGDCGSGVLCDLAQPIVAILVIPSNKTAGKKHEQARLRGLPKAKDLHGDSMLIVGQLGRIILITGVKDESNELDNDPFLPVTRSFSWKTRNKTSTAAQLAGKGLTFHEWDLSSPVTSACMLGPHRLCYCSRSEVLYVDLFEIVEKSTAHLDSGRIEDVSRGRTRPGGLSSLKSASTENRPHASATGLRSEQWVVKEELLPQIVPIADVVVAIVGRGISGSSGGSRPLMALTARGRLLGVEVSDHVSSPASSNKINVPKSWRSLKAQRERQVQDLLQAVATVTKCTEGVKSHNSSINLALKEFATAFPLVYGICSEQTRNEVRYPELSLTRDAPRGKLSCFLTVTPFPSTFVYPKELSFRSSVLKAPSSHGFNPYLMKISVSLHNKTHVTLSQYWSLLLKLETFYSDPTDVLSYSLIINRGLGLASGAHFSHDFIVELPSIGLCPLLVSMFLCHLHDPHQSIIDYNSPPCTFSRTLSQNDKGIIRLKMQSGKREQFPSKGIVSDKEISGPCLEDDMSAMETSGSVCLLLCNYRVDLLSLFQSQRLTEKNPWTYYKMVDKSEQGEAPCSSDHLLGSFSGNLLLSSSDDAKILSSSDMGKLWQELHLGELTQKTTLLTVPKRSSSSVLDDDIVSVTLEQDSSRGSHTMSLSFQASSLLLGSLARESLLWRIKEGDAQFHLQGNDRGNVLDSEKIDAHGQMKEKTPDDLSDIVQRVQKFIGVWRNTLVSGDSAAFASLLHDTGSTVEAVLTMYRTHRRHCFSH